MSEVFSTAAWQSNEMKEELLERITEINKELDVIDVMNNENIARNKLGKFNLEAETPIKNF